ncbi:hypothetical protein X740_21900 [Mesorhizobium sp. LNHC221B00]|nr:hypothetical protein X740_21900 [Mesorhizobium sp. LNHC221B00]
MRFRVRSALDRILLQASRLKPYVPDGVQGSRSDEHFAKRQILVVAGQGVDEGEATLVPNPTHSNGKAVRLVARFS